MIYHNKTFIDWETTSNIMPFPKTGRLPSSNQQENIFDSSNERRQLQLHWLPSQDTAINDDGSFFDISDIASQWGEEMEIDELLSDLSDSDSACDSATSYNKNKSQTLMSSRGYNMEWKSVNNLQSLLEVLPPLACAPISNVQPSPTDNITLNQGKVYNTAPRSFRNDSTFEKVQLQTNSSSNAHESQLHRLRQVMIESSLTQAWLQDWDRLNGLPASHSRTMVNSARSRKQLMEGVLLKKWNGKLLLQIASEESLSTTSNGQMMLNEV